MLRIYYEKKHSHVHLLGCGVVFWSKPKQTSDWPKHCHLLFIHLFNLNSNSFCFRTQNCVKYFIQQIYHARTVCQTHARTHKHEDAFIRMISANLDLNSCHYFKLDLTNISYKFTVICTGTAKKQFLSLYEHEYTHTDTRARAHKRK